MYIITLNKLISLPVCNHSLYLNIHCLQKEWERWGKKSRNATQGNIQIEQSVYSTNTYFLINIQTKTGFSPSEKSPEAHSLVFYLNGGGGYLLVIKMVSCLELRSIGQITGFQLSSRMMPLILCLEPDKYLP